MPNAVRARVSRSNKHRTRDAQDAGRDSVVEPFERHQEQGLALVQRQVKQRGGEPIDRRGRSPAGTLPTPGTGGHLGTLGRGELAVKLRHRGEEANREVGRTADGTCADRAHEGRMHERIRGLASAGRARDESTGVAAEPAVS